MNANLIFKWLRDARFAPEGVSGEEAVFLPVEISRSGLIDEPMVSEAVSRGDAMVRIELAGGHRIIAESGFDPDALGRLLKGWLS